MELESSGELPFYMRKLRSLKIKIMNYSQEFIKTVENAHKSSEQFYSVHSNENEPNPYFIGFGNPNARILIIGKELSFDRDNPDLITQINFKMNQFKILINGLAS